MPESSVALDRLVGACLAGDRAAMQQIYEHCSDRVYALMVRIVGRQDADDLTQQVFLQMFRKLDQFRGGSKLETWLYRLATNEAPASASKEASIRPVACCRTGNQRTKSHHRNGATANVRGLRFQESTPSCEWYCR